MVLRYVFFALLTRPVLSTFYYTEERICDPGQSNMVPFSGFKISKNYYIDFYNSKSTHTVTLDHCTRGKHDFGHFYDSSHTDFINWEQPFCVLQNSEKKPGLLQRLVNTTSSIRNLDSSNWKHAFEMLLEDLVQKGLEHKRIGYSKGLENDELSEFDFLNKDHIERLGSKVTCYKMARRRKYAMSTHSFYLPGTFVGALFECQLQSAEKVRFIRQQFEYKAIPFSQNFECDKKNSVPLSPLIAQDMTTQWLQVDLKKLRLKQSVPYLAGPSILDPRFMDLSSTKWATDIDMNENYSYSQTELDFATRALQSCSNLVGQLVSSVNLDLFMSTIHSGVFKNLKIRALAFNSLSSDHIVSIALAVTDHSLRFLQQLQDLWTGFAD